MNYYLKKSISFVLTLFIVAFLSYLLFSIIPGDAALARLSIDATPEQIEALRESYGYNLSFLPRFFKWLAGAIRGDFGMSMQYSGMTVGSLIAQRLPVTLLLALMSILMTALVSIPLGLVSAKHPGGVLDRISGALSQVVMAVPSFVQGILVTLVFGIVFSAFTPGAYIPFSENPGKCLEFMFFPALAVALPKTAMTVKFMKSSVKRELNLDYVRTAFAKGNTENAVMWKHVMKNSLMPVITFLGLIVAEVMAGSIMIEQVFNLPGMGRLLVTSIANRDFNVVQAIVIYIAFIVILVNFIVDIIYKRLDPRLD